MSKKEIIHDNWGEIHIDVESGDEWLKFGVPSNFTEDFSPCMVRLPGPNVQEIVHLAFQGEFLDEIYAAAAYLTAFEVFENQRFRAELVCHLEDIDFKKSNQIQRKRFRKLIEATNLAHYEPVQRNGEDTILVAQATILLNKLV
jgi:hypothetical protein